MKKFHTLPGVIPRVGVAEGRGTFARWSFTASAALLLLLSAEGAQGAGADSCRPLLGSEIDSARKQLPGNPADKNTIGAASFICCGPNANPTKSINTAHSYIPSGTGCTLKATRPDPNKDANNIFIQYSDYAKLTAPSSPTTAAVTPPSVASTNSGAGTAPGSGTTTGSGTGGTESAPSTGGGTFTNLSGTFPRGNSPTPKPSSAFTVGSPSGASPTATPGSTAGGQSTAAYTSNLKAWETKFKGDRKANQEEAGADPCVISSELGEEQGGIYKCAGTTRAVKNAQDITGGAVVVGTVGMAMKNQNAVNDALKSGSQSGNLDAQASIQAGQEDISKTIGAIQMTQALMLKSKADSHGKNIRQLEGNLVKSDAMQSKESMVLRNDHSNDDATAALEKFVQKGTSNGVSITGTTVPGSPAQDLGVGYLRKSETPDAGSDAAGQEVAKDLNAAVKFVGRAAVTEQKNIQDKANEEAKSMFQQAAIAFTVAEQARKNKETLRGAAQSVKQVEKSTKDLAFQFAPNDRSANQLAAPNQSLSLSSAQDASQSKTDGLGQNGTDDPTGETPNFGAPFGAPNDPFAQPSPQPVGEFQRNPNGGGGGGGGGAGGGTSTQPSGNDDDHGGGGSTYAKLATTSDKYSAGGGGVGGSGGGGNAGMDFTGMLSQFLPKPEDQGPKNGILDFGARAPAQTALPSSLLDASANLFERVHEAYQSKNRKGQVGQAVSGGKNP